MALERAVISLHRYMREVRDAGRGIDPRMRLLTAMIYIATVISVPLTCPTMLVWLLCYPIIMAEAQGIGYGHILLRSMWILPLVALVGAFNPIMDQETYTVIAGVRISRGWVTFGSLTLRGLLAFQALLVLVDSCGFRGICRALSHMGVPDVLVTQLLMMFRFLAVVFEQAMVMHRSRQARGFGRKSYPLRMWGVFVGQLLLQSIRRAARVNRAMLARGYEGNMYREDRMPHLRARDWLFLTGWCLVFAAIRFIPLLLR